MAMLNNQMVSTMANVLFFNDQKCFVFFLRPETWWFNKMLDVGVKEPLVDFIMISYYMMYTDIKCIDGKFVDILYNILYNYVFYTLYSILCLI